MPYGIKPLKRYNILYADKFSEVIQYIDLHEFGRGFQSLYKLVRISGLLVGCSKNSIFEVGEPRTFERSGGGTRKPSSHQKMHPHDGCFFYLEHFNIACILKQVIARSVATKQSLHTIEIASGIREIASAA